MSESRFTLRLPAALCDEIKEAATANGRSMNAEIVARIQGDSRSLRDWFAGQAMAAIVAKTPFQEYPEDWSPYEKTAIGAYDYADAMIAAREEGQ